MQKLDHAISYVLVVSGSCSGLHDSDHGGGGQVTIGQDNFKKQEKLK